MRFIIDNLPKKQIVKEVLLSLDLKEEKVYDVDIFFQKLSFIFEESVLAEKGQLNINEALEEAEFEIIYLILSQ